MEQILQLYKNEYFNLGILALNALLIIIFIINTISTSRAKKTYKTLIKKIGKSNNIEEMLRDYMDKAEEVRLDNRDIKIKYDELKNEMNKTLKKVGVVRYSAFKDMGSDLSFALALLDESNSGVVLNGIYSIETSTIYAKPVEDGKSKYTLSEEEKQAIDIAMQK